MAGGGWSTYFASALGGGGLAPRMAGMPRPPRAAPRAWGGLRERLDSKKAARTRSAMLLDVLCSVGDFDFKQPLAARLVLVLPQPTQSTTKKKQRTPHRRRTIQPPLTTDSFVYLLIDDDTHALSGPDHECQRTLSKYPIARYATCLHVPHSDQADIFTLSFINRRDYASECYPAARECLKRELRTSLAQRARQDLPLTHRSSQRTWPCSPPSSPTRAPNYTSAMLQRSPSKMHCLPVYVNASSPSPQASLRLYPGCCETDRVRK